MSLCYLCSKLCDVCRPGPEDWHLLGEYKREHMSSGYYLSYRNPIPIISPISPSFQGGAYHLHLFTLLLPAKEKKKKKNSSCNIRYSLLWISSEIQMIEKGVCTFSLLRGGCPRPRLVNKNFNVHIGFSTSHYFYNPHIKQYWCIKCLPFADCVSLYRQDIPEDLHHVQRPQPSWQDDLVINEQKTVLTITRREKTDQNNQQFSGLWLRVSIPSVTFISGRLDDRGRDIGWIRSLFFHFWKSPAFWVESDKKTNWIFFCCCCWTECVIKNTSGEWTLCSSSVVIHLSLCLSIHNHRGENRHSFVASVSFYFLKEWNSISPQWWKVTYD